jgi:hypothetical protein
LKTLKRAELELLSASSKQLYVHHSQENQLHLGREGRRENVKGKEPENRRITRTGA